MAPDLFPVSTLPEARLRYLLQANALVNALLAAACVFARASLTSLLHLTSPAFSLLFAFAFAFSSAFLFRVSVRDTAARRFAIVAAFANFALAVLSIVFAAFNLFHLSHSGINLLFSFAAITTCFAVLELLLLNVATHVYAQPQVLAV